MLKLIGKVACFIMVLSMATSVLAQEDINNTMSGKVIEERIAIIEMSEDMQAKGTIGKEPTMQSTVITVSAEETVPEETKLSKMTETEKKSSRQTGIITARKGIVRDSPCGPNGNDGQEIWYPTHPGGAVKILAKEKGFYDLEMTVCKEEGPRKGVRIISGYTPDGQYFENLVVVAADIKSSYNPDAAFERGDFIQTSLGPGFIVDFCGRAKNERRYNGITYIDIAVDW